MFYLQDKQRVNQMPQGQNWEHESSRNYHHLPDWILTMLRTRASWCLPAPPSVSPWIGTFCTPSLTQYCILVVAEGGEQIPRQQHRLRGICTRDTDSITCGKLSGTWSQSGWDPSAVMGRDFGGAGSSNFLHVVSVAASLQGPPPTLSRPGSVTNSMRHEWRCVTSKAKSQKTVLSLGSPLSVGSLLQPWSTALLGLYERPAPTWAAPKIPSPQTLLNSLEVICYAAITNYFRAEGGERTGNVDSGQNTQGPGNSTKRFLHLILSEKGAI